MAIWDVSRPPGWRAADEGVEGQEVAQALGQGALDYLASCLPAADRIRDVL